MSKPTRAEQPFVPITWDDIMIQVVRTAVRMELESFSREDSPRGDSQQSYLRIQDAAEIAKLGESTIRSLIRTGQLKASKIGERIIIKRSDLDELLNANVIVKPPL